MSFTWAKVGQAKALGIAVVMAVFFKACSLGGPLREDKSARGYRLGELNSSWAEQKVEQSASRLFLNQHSGAAIGVNSLCKRYEEASLQTLTKSLTRPLQNASIHSQNSIQLDGREALVSDATGTLDGVPIEARFVVLRKNDCLFDFSLIGKQKLSTDEKKDFEKLLSGFH